MGKRKVAYTQMLEDLAAEVATLPDGVFYDELHDAVMCEARLTLDDLRASTVLEQIEYLYMRGYEPGRIRQLIEEFRKEMMT